MTPSPNKPVRLLAPMLLIASSALAGVDDRMLADASDGRNWASYGRTFTEDHYSPLAQIDTHTVGRLALAWHYDLTTSERADSQPLAADGVVYVATGLSIVRALDAQTGRLIWEYDPDVGKVAGRKLRAGWGIRGLALWGAQVYVGTQDGRLVALDARSGKLLWSTLTLDEHDETIITGAPRAFNGKVIIGFSGAERLGTRGAVSCFDAMTGKRLWRFYTVPGNPAKGFENDAMRMAAKTWTGEWWRIGGGGAVWNAMTYDSELNRVYIGTSNGLPINPRVRNPGGKDNLFLASIVALDANTGRYLWHYQENPNEAWDYDSTTDIVLASLTINGRPTKVLLHASKNGFLYVLDRRSGRLISAEKIGKVTWASHVDLRTGRPVEYPVARYGNKAVLVWPSYYGMHSWPPMSFSAKSSLLYIPTVNMGSYYTTAAVDPKNWAPRRDSWVTGLGETADRPPYEQFSSSLLAWDAVSRREVWRVQTAGLWSGGTMVTSGNLVFQGQLDGTFNAYDSQSGRRTWTFDAGAAVTAAPIGFLVGGTQYITVLTGPPAASAANQPGVQRFGWDYRNTPRRVLTFALDGKDSLPASTSRGPVSPRSDGPPADANLAKSGAALFASNCSMNCHGADAVSGGGAPDLRASVIALSSDAFARVVRNGALESRGMPRFEEFSGQELEMLRNYVRRRAQTDSSMSASH